MAKSFDSDIEQETTPNSRKFSPEWNRTFNALDAIRGGEVMEALAYFYDKEFYHFSEYNLFEMSFIDRGHTFRKHNPEPFFNAMIDVAMMLRQEGL